MKALLKVAGAAATRGPLIPVYLAALILGFIVVMVWGKWASLAALAIIVAGHVLVKRNRGRSDG